MEGERGKEWDCDKVREKAGRVGRRERRDGELGRRERRRHG